MAATLIILALCAASTVATGVPAAKYPAGVDPHLCPNYPFCDNVALATHTNGLHGTVALYAAPTFSVYGQHSAAAQGAGDKYPAGVDPHHCPNYPYCGPTTVHGILGYSGTHGVSHVSIQHGWADAHAAPVWKHGTLPTHHGAGAQYPASVDPQSCPNYPYCH